MARQSSRYLILIELQGVWKMFDICKLLVDSSIFFCLQITWSQSLKQPLNCLPSISLTQIYYFPRQDYFGKVQLGECQIQIWGFKNWTFYLMAKNFFFQVAILCGILKFDFYLLPHFSKKNGTFSLICYGFQFPPQLFGKTITNQRNWHADKLPYPRHYTTHLELNAHLVKSPFLGQFFE